MFLYFTNKDEGWYGVHQMQDGAAGIQLKFFNEKLLCMCLLLISLSTAKPTVLMLKLS